jgi:hypothetical protein
VGKKAGRDVDAEVDFHGCTAEQMRHALEQRWAQWRGMKKVRVIHGRGAILKPELERWCEEMGIPFSNDAQNAGSTCIFPTRRTIPSATLRTTLREKGLRLTPEQEAYLRDPQAIERAQQEELRRKQQEERRRQAEEAVRAAERRRAEALWQAEIARLTALDKQRAPQPLHEGKPRAPVVLPPSVIKNQEGYWRAEIVRVGDTDTDTLKKEKITGLDKLAPPLELKPKPKEPQKQHSAAPQRDEAADRALFEAEMERLMHEGR